MIRALRFVLYVIAALVLLVAAGLVFLATPPGRSVVASIVERAVSGSGIGLSIGTLSGWPPFSFGADRIVVSDKDGAFAEVDGLRVDIGVGALLAGRIGIDALTADRVAVSRQPVLPSTGGSGNAALLPLAADHFSIAKLELDAGLIGHPATLSVSGAFATTRAGAISASINAERTDGRLGTLTAKLDRAGPSSPLMIDLTLEEAADGVLLGLMGRDDGPGYRLVAQTGLSGETLDGAVSLTSEGDARFAGQFTLTTGGEGAQRLKVSGEGDLAELVPPALADFLSGAIKVAVDADWSKAAGDALPRITIHEGKVDTGTVHGEATGTFGGAVTDLSLRLDAAKPNGGGFALPIGSGAPLGFDTVSLTGRIAPGTGSTRLDLVGRVAGLSSDGIGVPAIGFSVAVEADGEDPLADKTLPFALRAEADALDIAGKHIPGGEATPLVLTAQGTLDVATMTADATADLTIAGGKATYAGTIAADAVTGSAKADFADVAPLAVFAGRSLRGAVSVAADGRFAGAEGLDLKIDGRATNLDVGEPALAKFLAGETQIAGALSEDADGRIAVKGLSLDVQGISLTGDIALGANTVDATLAGEIADLSLLADGSRGAASVKATVSGSIDAPNIDATLTVPEGTLLDQAIADASIRFEGAPRSDGWDGKLTLGGKLAGQELGGTARVIVADGGGIGLPEVDLTIAGNHVKGSVESAGAGLFTGALVVDATDLKPLAAMLEVEASGAAKFNVTLAPEGKGQGVSVAFSGGGVTVEGVDAGKVDGNVTVTDALGTPVVQGKADLADVAIDTFKLDTATIAANIANGATTFTAAAKGPDVDLNGDASLDTDASGTTIHVSRLEGTAFGFPVKTAAPADIVAARGGDTRLSGVTLAAGGGSIRADGMVAPQLDLQIAVDNVAGSFVDSVAPDLGAEGTVTGKASVKGASANPTIAWQAEWTDFTVAASRSAGLPQVRLTGSGTGDLVSTSVNVNLDGGGLTGVVTGTVPFTGGDIVLSVAGKSTGLDIGQPMLAKLFSGETSFSAKVTVGPAGKIAVADIAVEGTAVSVTGDVALGADTVDATLAGEIADLSLVAEDSHGAASVKATVSGSLDAPNVDATVSVPEGTLLDQAIADASIRFEGAPVDSGWQGKLTLAGKLAGQELAGTARAEIAASGGGLSFPAVDLTVAGNHVTGAIARTDAGLLSGSLDVNAPDLKTLGALLLVDAAGAAEAHLTFAPEDGRQGISVSFTGNGIAVDSLVAGKVDGEAKIDDALGNLAVHGHADLASVAIGSLQLDSATLTATVEGGATQFEATAKGPDIDLTGTGSLATEAGATSLRVTSLTGTAFGFPVDTNAPATVDIASGETRISNVSLAVGGGSVSVNGVVSPQLDLQVAIETVAASFVNGFVPDLGAEGTISGSATVTGTPAKPVLAWQAEWTDFAIAASRSIGLPPVRLSVKGSGDGTATSIDANLTGGGLAVAVTGNVPFAGGDVVLNVAGTSIGLDIGQPMLAKLLSGETSFSAKVTAGPTGKIAVADIAVEGTAISMTGDFSLEGDSVSGAVDGRIADLGILAEQSTGTASFNAKVSGSLATPNIDATVIVGDGRILDQTVKNASVQFVGAPSDGGWSGTLTLAGELAGRALSGTARAELAASGGLAFPEVDLTVAENHITGAIERTAAGLLSGSLDVNAPDLKSLAAILLIEATGSAEARVAFTPVGDQQSVKVAFTGRNIAAPSVAVQRIDGEVEIANALAIPMVRGHASATALTIGSLRLDSASVTASVENGATKFEGGAKGPEISLAASGSLADQSGTEVIRLTRLTGSAFGFPLELAAPATVTMASKGTSISDVSLAAGGGRITAGGTVSPTLNLKLAVNGVAGSFINRFSPGLGAQGSISGGATVTGTPASPKIAWQLNWTGFGVAASVSAGLPPLVLTAAGAATGTATTVDATLAGAGLSLRVTGNVPYSGTGLKVRAQGTAPLALLAGDSGDLRVTGTTRLDIGVSGSTARPSVDGTFDLIDAAAADTAQGVGVTGISGRIRFDGTTARIERLSGRLIQGGEVTVAGSVAVDPAANFPANLTIRIRNGRYIDGTVLDTSFNADLTLTGPVLGNGTLGGRVDLLRTEVLLPDSFGGGPPITVQHIHVEPGFVPPMDTIASASTSTASAGGGSGGFNLSLSLNSRSGIFVRGFGLDAELGGSTRIEGTTDSPRATGGFQMRRGRIELLGRRFDFTRGILTFTGSLDPVLDFDATTTAGDITARVKVTGPATDPDIVLTSSPSLPEEEIISRILFGRSIGSLSAVQAIQLVDAIAQFSGAYARGDGVFARLRRTLGLDDLDISQNAAGGTTVGIGKRITDTVSVGVQTETNGTSKVTIDVDLTKSLKAQVQGGADGSGRVGLSYEHEY